MWGLLRKDLKSLAAQGRVAAILAIFYVVLFFLSEGEDSAASMLTAMVVLLTILLPVTAGALRRAEQMSVAMEARGFRSRPQRTYMRRLRMRRTDWAWLLAPTLSILAVALL